MPERLINQFSEYKYSIIILMAWAARLAFMSGITLALIIRQLIISVFVGYVASEYILQTGFEDRLKTSLFAAIVFLADDVLKMVLTLGTQFLNSDTFKKRVCSFIRGK